MSVTRGSQRIEGSRRPLDKRGGLNIIVSSPTFLPVVGGAELGIHEIYDRIGARHNVTILTPRLPAGVVTDFGANDYMCANYDVCHLVPRLESLRPRIIGRAAKRVSLPYIWHIRQLARTKRIDVINFHYITPHGGAMIAAGRIWGTPTILSLVGRSDVLHLLNPFRRWYGSRVAASATQVIRISDYYLQAMRQSVNSELIPYGVDVSEFTPTQASSGLRELLNIGHNDIMLLCVQRLTSVKRVDMLLRMLAHVIGRHPEAVLVIVGQGPEEAKLKDLAQRLRLDSHVRFCGYVESSKLPSYYASADLFVFHSMLETFGIVFAQAMASGLPIVAASTSCVPYTIHDDNGVLVKPEDPQAFSQAVCLLIEDQEQRISIGATNRARAVQEFDWDMIAKKYEDVFERLVATS